MRAPSMPLGLETDPSVASLPCNTSFPDSQLPPLENGYYKYHPLEGRAAKIKMKPGTQKCFEEAHAPY